LGLLARLNTGEALNWHGRFRSPLGDVVVHPRPVQTALPIWIAVGGTPASVVRAGRLGLPLYLAILGQPGCFVELAELYRRNADEAGVERRPLRVGVTSHFYVEETSQGARETFYPHYSRYIGQYTPNARNRPLARDAYEAWRAPHGALFVGSPPEIIDKILWEFDLLGHDRFLAQIELGGLPFAATARAIELVATEVLPVVRRETAPTLAR
jgi:alkanesulfonate monooxygenase SsuD/methylene tetrahydromethanopterin reductase-like flavin-dependent oxidoreductase (luciferase family)